MIKYILFSSLILVVSCDGDFKGELNSFQDGTSQSEDGKETTQSEDAKPANFETGHNVQVVRTEGLFGDGSDLNVDLPAAGIKAIKGDGSESMEEIKVPNAEPFRIIWESKFVKSCTVTATKSDGSTDAKFSWDELNGEKTVERLMGDTTFTLTCEAEGETLTDSVLVKVDGGWIPVARNLSNSQKVCSTFCSDRGMFNSRSSDGALCASGESLPATAIGFLTHHYGCWGDCNLKHGAQRGSSFGHRCYGEGQKQDSDSTDVTVGCYCIRTTL